MQKFSQSTTSQQVQTTRISPQQIQFLNLLQLNVNELDNYIEKAIEVNPFLEIEHTNEDKIDTPTLEENNAENTPWDSLDTTYEAFSPSTAYSNNELIDWYGKQDVQEREELLQQLEYLPLVESVKDVTRYLIEALDEHGYLRHTDEDLSDDYSFATNVVTTEKEISHARSLIQQLEPIGIGARNLKECLLLQLQHLPSNPSNNLAKAILEEHIELLSTKNYTAIQEVFQISKTLFDDAIKAITSLRPMPLEGLSNNGFNNLSKYPDYHLTIEEDSFNISVARNKDKVIRINQSASLKAQSNAKKAALTFVHQKIKEGEWLIEALKQRETTMAKIFEAILITQKKFFLSGDKRDLVPMKLKDIAAYSGYDMSTVSRTTSRKFIDAPYGIVKMKDLFVATFKDKDGQSHTQEDALLQLKSIIESEDPASPYYDSQLAKRMKNHGFHLARRTIAKYRSALNIETSDKRTQ